MPGKSGELGLYWDAKLAWPWEELEDA